MTCLAPPPLPDGAILVGGAWVDYSGPGRIDHINPATGKPQGSFVVGGPEEINAAVDAARRALPAWRSMPAHARRGLLLRVAAALTQDDERLGLIAAVESGRLYIRGSTFLAAEYFRYYAGWTEKRLGFAKYSPDGTSMTAAIREPCGVVAVIIPWNGPLTSIGMKVAPALASGNTVVLKPPELAPFAALRFAELCQEVGMPPGVLNVIPSGAKGGEALVRNAAVAKVSFTGGLSTARKVAEAAAENLTPVVLELGGKSASIVFDDADLSRAGRMAALLSLQVNAGQGCCLPTRLLVQNNVYDEVVHHVVTTARSLRLGDPLDEGTSMGPVISARAADRILAVIERACSDEHGILLTGGGRAGGALSDGFFVEPTVFGDVDNESPLAQEEIFGPVLSIERFETDQDAVTLANRSNYGLGAFVYTRDIRRAHRTAAELEAGMVAINGMSPMLPTMPFGGMKQSGYGREGGWVGMAEFCRTKELIVGLR
jgi:acyl-CoA reductase-like NAD-dependent aldehyde dehydrogenase